MTTLTQYPPSDIDGPHSPPADPEWLAYYGSPGPHSPPADPDWLPGSPGPHSPQYPPGGSDMEIDSPTRELIDMLTHTPPPTPPIYYNPPKKQAPSYREHWGRDFMEIAPKYKTPPKPSYTNMFGESKGKFKGGTPRFPVDAKQLSSPADLYKVATKLRNSGRASSGSKRKGEFVPKSTPTKRFKKIRPMNTPNFKDVSGRSNIYNKNRIIPMNISGYNNYDDNYDDYRSSPN